MTNIVFQIIGIVNGHNRTEDKNIPNCPRCKSRVIRITANEKCANVRCTVCFWEEYYIRIRKNGEGLI